MHATGTCHFNAADELAASTQRPFEQALAMPKSVYRCEQFLQHELNNIFRRDWFCAGRASSLAKPGDYLTLELAGQPIMVIRSKQGQLRAQSNVCLHRMSTLLQGRGNKSAIVCPYHAWTYDTDGRLRAAPAMDQNTSFCKDGMVLPSIRCEVWLGWIMLTLNDNAPPVSDVLSDVESLVGDYEMEHYEETFVESHTWNTNWKVLAENFMESYHLPVCHKGTVGNLSKLEDMICPPGLPAFNYHTILKDDTLKIAMAHDKNQRLSGERRRMTYLLAIYPSLLITLTPGYFWYLSLHPDGVDKVSILFGGGMSPDYVNDPESKENFSALKTLLDNVNLEDKGCTEKVYKGLCSDFAAPGPLSHLERPNYDFARYLSDRIPSTDTL